MKKYFLSIKLNVVVLLYVFRGIIMLVTILLTTNLSLNIL